MGMQSHARRRTYSSRPKPHRNNGAQLKGHNLELGNTAGHTSAFKATTRAPSQPPRQHIGDNLLQRRCLWRTQTAIDGPVSNSSRGQTIITTSKGRHTTGHRPPIPPLPPEWVQNPKLPAFLLQTAPSGSSKGSPPTEATSDGTHGWEQHLPEHNRDEDELTNYNTDSDAEVSVTNEKVEPDT